MIRVPVLTIRQPWAWAILEAGKDVENRTWGTTYRGPIGIHAAKGMTRGEYDWFEEFLVRRFQPKALYLPAFHHMERGAIVGIADLVDCTKHSESPWFSGPVGFVLRDALAFAEPIPAAGKLGFWYPPPDVAITLEDLVLRRGVE